MAFNITKNFTVTNARQIPYVPPGAAQVLIDKYFGSTTLLLQADTTNTGTIVDSSTNNFSASITGTPVQGAVSPFVGAGGSEYFNGSTDYLTIPNNSAFNFDTGSFTVEGWFYAANNVSNQQCIITNYQNASSGWSVQIFAGTIGVNLSGDSFDLTSSTVVINRWYHFAVSGQSGNIKLFLDGIQQGSAFTGATSINTTSVIYIGKIDLSGYFNGYISNLRVLKGTALYTSNFTPSTTPLTAVTNTSLLLKFDNGKFIDSTNQNVVSIATGTPTISTSPFKYGTGALSFNGSSSLAVPTTNGLNTFGSSNFTVECWVNPNVLSEYRVLMARRASTSIYSGLSPYLNANGSVGVVYANSASSWVSLTSGAGLVSVGTWAHIAVVRNGSTLALYINGTQAATTSVAGSHVVDSSNILIGGDVGADIPWFNGYMDDVRITNGFARYTASFTPPTTKLPSNGATGGTITYSGADVIHTFTSTGTFKSTTQISAAALVVAGGGAGGYGDTGGAGGGGGAGGYISTSSFSISLGSYSVTVGAGGPSGGSANSGSNSIFSSLISFGGGAGGRRAGGTATGQNGGSGGGGYGTGPGPGQFAGGSGTAGQGNAGGVGGGSAAQAGGGGGAGASGGSSTNSAAGVGGAGLSNNISGTTVFYAGGGGGAEVSAGGSAIGTGGTGGGGTGYHFSGIAGTSGVANTGGGGGGGFNGTAVSPSGAGGSGIVIIRYAAQ